jgi:uncharacterized membrane protein YgdD (TMEM256/DUF423 family)
MPSARRTLLLAAILLLIATILGAFGTHALKPHLTPARFDSFLSGVTYQFYGGFGLLAIGILQRSHDVACLRWSARLLLLGVVLFSGSIYAITFGAPTIVVMAAPFGGTALMAGWIAFGVAAWRMR